MAWIELHDTLATHPKTYALSSALDIPQHSAVGILCLLWTWALNAAQDGDLSKFPPQAIARACFWTKKPDVLMDALVQCGWVDESLFIHDWYEYAGRLIEKREDTRKRVSAYRTSKKEVRNANGTRYVTRTVREQYASTVPNSTVPNQTVPKEELINAREQTPLISQEEADALQSDIDTIRREAQRCGLPTTDKGMDDALSLKDAHGMDKLLEAIRKTGEQTKDKWHWRYVAGVLKEKPPVDDGKW